MEEIKVTDLSAWLDDEQYGVEAAAVADVLNQMLARIATLERAVERLTRSAGRCECMNCVVIGV